MIIASDFIQLPHLHLFLKETRFIILLPKCPLSDVLENTFSCFLFDRLVVFSEYDGGHLGSTTDKFQPRPQGLIVFQFGGGRREDPGIQRTKTIADWCIPWCVHSCALIGLLFSKQGWWPFEGFVESEKSFLQSLRPKRWTEFRSDCLENCNCTVGRHKFQDSSPI